jgi:transcriptional regulator with XRE-family HTH domain
MRLSAFLDLPGQSATDIARKCDVAVSTITRVAKGEKNPSLELMARIRAATHGAVTGDDFLPPFNPEIPGHGTASPSAQLAAE